MCQPNNASMEEVYKAEVECLRNQLKESKNLLIELVPLLKLERDFASCDAEHNEIKRLLSKINKVCGEEL